METNNDSAENHHQKPGNQNYILILKRIQLIGQGHGKKLKIIISNGDGKRENGVSCRRCTFFSVCILFRPGLTVLICILYTVCTRKVMHSTFSLINRKGRYSFACMDI